MTGLDKLNIRVRDLLNNHISKMNIRNMIFSLVFLIILTLPLIEDIVAASRISGKMFFAKDQMISAVNNFKYHVVKDRVFNELIADQNGWLIYTGELSLQDVENSDPFTSAELDQYDVRLNNLCEVLTQDGTSLILVIAPNKNTIYPEYLPAEISKSYHLSRVDQVLTIWEDTDNCKFLDLRRALMAAKENNLIYYSTDTHWNDIGAFIAYQEIAKELKKKFPKVRVRDITEFTTSLSEFSGGLTIWNFGHFDLQETTIDLLPKFSKDYSVLTFGPTQNLPSGLTKTRISYSQDASLPTAIIYHDSFFEWVIPFITENFKEAYFFWSFIYDLPFIESKKPDVLIIEITERYLEIGLSTLPVPQ